MLGRGRGVTLPRASGQTDSGSRLRTGPGHYALHLRSWQKNALLKKRRSHCLRLTTTE